MLTTEQMSAAVNVRNVGEWTETLEETELATGQQVLAEYTLRQRYFDSVAAAEQESADVNADTYIYRDSMSRIILAEFRVRREITPHKGGRTIKKSTDVTPEVAEMLAKIDVSLGDLVEEAVRSRYAQMQT